LREGERERDREIHRGVSSATAPKSKGVREFRERERGREGEIERV
jgi:hypothetical protein